jgi:WD40 repeat protein
MKKLLVILTALAMAACTNPTDLDNGTNTVIEKFAIEKLNGTEWIFNLPEGENNNVYYAKETGEIEKIFDSDYWLFSDIHNGNGLLLDVQIVTDTIYDNMWYTHREAVNTYKYDLYSDSKTRLDNPHNEVIALAPSGEFYVNIGEEEDQIENWLNLIYFDDLARKKIAEPLDNYWLEPISISPDNKYLFYYEHGNIGQIWLYDIENNSKIWLTEFGGNQNISPLTTSWISASKLYIYLDINDSRRITCYDVSAGNGEPERSNIDFDFTDVANIGTLEAGQNEKLILNDENAGIYIYDLRTNEQKTIFPQSPGYTYNMFPKWIPDSQKFMFVRMKSELEFENNSSGVLDKVVFEYLIHDLKDDSETPVISDTVEQFRLQTLPLYWGHFPVE